MLKAYFKLILLMLWIAGFYLPVLISKKLKKRAWRDKCLLSCYAGLVALSGVKLKVYGKLSPARPMLVVSNHLSYIDIFILASRIPVHFTPKSEIANWPIIGHICRICETVFIDRKPDKVKEAAGTIQMALERGDIISIFPEATTGNGVHLLPFRSGFFSLAEMKTNDAELVVQPVAIAYSQVRRLPIDSTQWPDIAWYGDMELMPHLLRFLEIGPVTAELILLPPVTMSQFGGDRKALAQHCHDAVEKALEEVRVRKYQTHKVLPGKFWASLRLGNGNPR